MYKSPDYEYEQLSFVNFNTTCGLQCAVEEMPAGYGDTLMSVSPAWTFPVVVIIGIIVSVLIANVFMKNRKLLKNQGVSGILLLVSEI